MKRIIEKEIDNCLGCPFCEVLDGFASHDCLCNHYGLIIAEVDSPESAIRAEMEMDEWFKNCQVWPESQEIDSPMAQERKAKP